MHQEGFTAFSDLDADALKQWEGLLRTRKGRKAERISRNTVRDHLKVLAYLYQFREELGDADEHPHPAELQPRNVFPDLPGFREAVLDYMNALSGLGHRLMASIGRGLRLGDNYFVDRYTGRPTTLFRISREAGPTLGQPAEGLLTLLHEDDGGLQVKRGSRWVDVPYVPGSIAVGIGDVLERLTSGHYISAAHRTISHSGQAHIGLPFSFGPSVDAVLRPIASLDRHGSDRTLIRLNSDPPRRCDRAYS
jgi:isopenicillin N synthase-like dioxygenase